MTTEVEIIRLDEAGLDLAAAIKAKCSIQLTNNRKLAATFVFGTSLVLIFQG